MERRIAHTADPESLQSLGLSVIRYLLRDLTEHDLNALRKAVQGRIDERKAEQREAAHA